MARGENPGTLLSVQCIQMGGNAVLYDKDEDFGHASAGKDLVLSLITTGSNAGQAQLGADDAKILGKFVDLDQKGVASYMPSAHPMLLRKTAAAIPPGSSLVCAGAGKVKADASAASRGQVIEIQETGDNGRILALMP